MPGSIIEFAYPAVADVNDILDALEITAIDADVRRTLQRVYYRRQKFSDGDGRKHLVIRAIACTRDTDSTLPRGVLGLPPIAGPGRRTSAGAF